MTTVVVVIVSYRAWSAERDRTDGLPGSGGKPQQYGRDAGTHNTRDGYMSQPPPRQWDNRGGYRPFVPGGMGYVSCLCLYCFFLNLYFSPYLPVLHELHSLHIPLVAASTGLTTIWILFIDPQHILFLFYKM